jgi:hypothetical protein
MALIPSSRSLCKYFLFLHILVHYGNAFELYATYTRFSGLVTTNVRVGSRRQPLRVSLDFAEETSRIFTKSACPVFVPACYDFEKSQTFFSTQFDDLFPDMEGVSAMDEIQLGMDRVFDATVFTLVTKWIPTSAAFREVSGIMAGGPGSPLFRNTILEISDALPEVNGVLVRSISAREADTRTHMAIQALPDMNRWLAPALLCVNGGSAGGVIRTIVHIDPSEEDLVLPTTMRAVFLDKLETAGILALPNGNHLLVNCSEAGDLDPRFDLSLRFPSGEISLLRSLFVLRGTVGEGFSDSQTGDAGIVCRVRIRFSSDSEHVVVGRQLIRSVNSVLFGYQSGMIGFNLRSARKRTLPSPSPLAKTLIPQYELPTVLSAVNATTVQLIQSASGSLVLSSLAVRDNCWVFLRTGPAPKSFFKDIELAGEFKGAALRIDNGLISITLSHEGSDGDRLKASLQYNSNSVQICIVEDGVPVNVATFTKKTRRRCIPKSECKGTESIGCCLS